MMMIMLKHFLNNKTRMNLAVQIFQLTTKQIKISQLSSKSLIYSKQFTKYSSNAG